MGELDYLVVDVPPGTGDEPLSVCQLIEDADGAVVVTTPQEVALGAVRRSITFCRALALPVLGVVENMSGFVCPKCGERTTCSRSAAGERLAREMPVPFLGRIPLDPRSPVPGARGMPYTAYADSDAAKASAASSARSPAWAGNGRRTRAGDRAGGRRCASPIPMAESWCRSATVGFTLVRGHRGSDTWRDRGQRAGTPARLLPRWLAGQGARLVITGASRAARGLFADGITIITARPPKAGPSWPRQ